MSKRTLESFNFEEGQVLLVDKPYGWTSYAVVNKLKRLVKAKMGHGGTLDPLASGLMILCTGRFTKKLGTILEDDKEYTGTIYLGATRPSCDRETEIDQTFDIAHITEEQVYEAAKSFEGEIEQIPPIFSAIKQDGKKLYNIARSGGEVEIRPRQVKIHAFEITGLALPMVYFRIHCSKGTYIRSLSRDIGVKLGVGSYLHDLRRTKSGQFSIEDAWDVEELAGYLFENKELILQHASVQKRK